MPRSNPAIRVQPEPANGSKTTDELLVAKQSSIFDVRETGKLAGCFFTSVSRVKFLHILNEFFNHSLP